MKFEGVRTLRGLAIILFTLPVPEGRRQRYPAQFKVLSFQSLEFTGGSRCRSG